MTFGAIAGILDETSGLIAGPPGLIASMSMRGNCKQE